MPTAWILVYTVATPIHISLLSLHIIRLWGVCVVSIQYSPPLGSSGLVADTLLRGLPSAPHRRYVTVPLLA